MALKKKGEEKWKKMWTGRGESPTVFSVGCIGSGELRELSHWISGKLFENRGLTK